MTTNSKYYVDAHMLPYDNYALKLWRPTSAQLEEMMELMDTLPATGAYTVLNVMDQVPRGHDWCEYTLRRTNGGADDGRIELDTRRLTYPSVLMASRPIKVRPADARVQPQAQPGFNLSIGGRTIGSTNGAQSSQQTAQMTELTRQFRRDQKQALNSLQRLFRQELGYVDDEDEFDHEDMFGDQMAGLFGQSTSSFDGIHRSSEFIY